LSSVEMTWQQRPNENQTAICHPFPSPIEGSLPENSAGRQPRFRAQSPTPKKSVKNDMSYGVKSAGRSLQRFGLHLLAIVRGSTVGCSAWSNLRSTKRPPWISAMQGVRRAAIVRPMTLEQLSALAQIVGAGAILASLIFVGLQIRQNTHSQRVVAVESL